jgi:hypothetical protein
MLGFFRKYQKSFMLIFLAPALIAMGITGAILAVLSDPGDQIAGRINGHAVHQKEFDVMRRLFRATNPRTEEDDAWRFLAELTAAKNAGLEVSDDEVRTGIHTDMQWSIARMAAMSELDALGVDRNSPNASKKFQELFFKHLMAKENSAFDIKKYKEALKQEKGLDHRSYEEQQRREVLVQRFLESMRDLAVIEPSAVWDAYQEKHQLRILDLVAIPGERYVATADAKEGERGYVSNEQVEGYYNDHVIEFDEPRRVNLRYAALRIADMEPSEVSEDGLRAFNKNFGIAPVASFNDFIDDVRKAYYSHEAKRRAVAAMDVIANAVADAEKGAKPEDVDLSQIVAKLKLSHSTEMDALIHGETGLSSEETLNTAADETLNGFASRRWFRVENTSGAVSDVLGDGSHLYVLQTREVEHARTPRFEDIKTKAREAYINGSDGELLGFYNENKNVRYRKGTSYKVEAATALDADYGGDHAKAEKGIDDAIVAANKWKKERFRRNWSRIEIDPDIKPRGLNNVELEAMDVDDLAKHNVLADAALDVPLRALWSLHKVELKDKTGWAVYRVARKEAVKTEKFKTIKETKVRKDLQLARGLERAEENVEVELAKLEQKSGDELAAAVKAMGLEIQTTEPFTRDAVTLEGIANAGALVAEAFSSEAVVGENYKRFVVDPDGDRLLLLRVAETQDAPKEGYEEQFAVLREDLLRARRADYVREQRRLLLLKAKGITSEHMAYATALRDGPGGITTLKLRQIFLPADKEVIGTWLEDAAQTRADAAIAELGKGAGWQSIVQRYSEHALTRGRGGELPAASKEDLAEEYGNAFAEAAYQLNEGDEPITAKSTQGLHIVRQTGENKGRKILEHILITLDPKRRELPAAIQKQAEEASKKSLEKAIAALTSGKPFSKVAEEFGDADDPIGQGQEFEIGYSTSLERAALAEYLEWELPEDHANADTLEFVPEAVEVKGADGVTTWQLFACSRDAEDRRAAWDPTPRRNRRVYHIQTATKAEATAAREEMLDFIQDKIADDGDRPTWNELLKKFQTVATERSTAPDKKKGGAFGLVRLQDSIRAYGEDFLKKTAAKADGSPVTAGYRPEVFRGEEGYHLIEVVEVVATADGEKRQREIADLVLSGTGWQ